MLKVAILGSSGLIGSALVGSFADTDMQIYELNQSGRSVLGEANAISIDLNDHTALEGLLRKLEVDYVVNAAVKYYATGDSVSSVHKYKMLSINVLLVKKLNELSTSLGFRLIHFSSDAVFSGKTGSYSESSLADPIDFYGRTKVFADEFADVAMVLRCSVVGVNKLNPSNLFSWLVTRPKKSEIEGYTNQVWNGLTALHLARIVRAIVLNGDFESGLAHIVPSGRANKYELLTFASEVFNRSDLSIIESKARYNSDRTLITINSVRNERLWNLAGYTKVPSVYQMIREYGIRMEGSSFV